MIKQRKKVDSVKATAAAKRAIAFWATLDGDTLAKIGLQEKDRDLVGAEKQARLAKLA